MKLLCKDLCSYLPLSGHRKEQEVSKFRQETQVEVWRRHERTEVAVIFKPHVHINAGTTRDQVDRMIHD